MAKNNFINRTEIYKLIGNTAEALLQLEETKICAEKGYLIESTINHNLSNKGLNSVAEEIKRNGKGIIPFIEAEIKKQEQTLINLVNQFD